MSDEKEMDLEDLKKDIDFFADETPRWAVEKLKRLIKELEEEREHRKKAVEYYQGEADKVKELKNRIKELEENDT